MALNDEGLITVPGLMSRYVQLSNGTRAHYSTSGEAGPTVVLLHGGIAGSSGAAGFRFMAPYLGANGFRVYAPDMPGFGLTADYERAYPAQSGIAGHVDFIHDFVRALCLGEFHLGGNSMGCINSVSYAVAHPERVRSLALIAGGVGDLVPQADMSSGRAKPNRPSIMGFDGSEESMRSMLSAIILDPSAITDDLIAMRTIAARRHHDYFERRRQYAFTPQSENAAAQLSTKGRFDRLTIPAVYVYGTEDVILPHDELGYRQEDALPNVQFFYPEHTGHQAQTDSPELLNPLFLEFFRDGRVSWKTAQAAGISERRAPLPDLVKIP